MNERLTQEQVEAAHKHAERLINDNINAMYSHIPHAASVALNAAVLAAYALRNPAKRQALYDVPGEAHSCQRAVAFSEWQMTELDRVMQYKDIHYLQDARGYVKEFSEVVNNSIGHVRRTGEFLKEFAKSLEQGDIESAHKHLDNAQLAARNACFQATMLPVLELTRKYVIS